MSDVAYFDSATPNGSVASPSSDARARGASRAVYVFGQWELDLQRRQLSASGKPVALGGRAFEIIETMVCAGGRLVTKEELLKRVWPDVAVEENTLHFHISAIRRALGADRALLKTQAGRGYRLLGAWTLAGSDAAEEPSPSEEKAPERRFRSNLPLHVSELIGRTAATRRLGQLLSAHRIVTLTGPGGIGKTRLALNVVESIKSGFEGDTLLVELAAVSDPKLVCSAVASDLGLKLGALEADPTLISRAIGDTRVLILLDNCEHVIEVAARLVESIAAMCPRVIVLATSREAMRIDGEVCFQVPGLDFPKDESLTGDDLLQYSAVKMFFSRMRTVHVDVAANERNARVMAAICRRLDGIPLAIELAAARAATLGLDNVAARLGQRFDLLTGGLRTALPRQQTLRATLDWSYELLPEAEQRALRFLATFAGPFNIEAATAVIFDSGAPAADASDIIAALVSKSLIALDESKGFARWRLLENTREYGRAKLDAHGEADEARSRHAAHYHGFFERQHLHSPTLSQAERQAFYADHLGNAVAALEWCFSAGGDARLGVTMANLSAPLFLGLVLFLECQRWTERAIEALTPDERGGRHDVELHAYLGLALTFTGDGARTREILAKGLALAEKLDDPHLHLRIIYTIFMQLCAAGDLRDALAMARRGEMAARKANDVAALSVAHAMLGNIHTLSGDQEAAELAFRPFLNWRSISNSVSIAHFGHNYYLLGQASYARHLWHRGYPDEAERVARRTIADAEEFGDMVTTNLCLVWALSVFRWTGDWAGTRRNVDKLIEHAGKATLTAMVSRGWMAQLYVEEGRAEEGIQALQDSLKVLRAIGRMFLWLIFKHHLAEAFAAAGRRDDALIALDEAIARIEAGGGFYNMPESLRLKGEILAAAPNADAADIEQWYIRSLELARDQGALSWELRSATSLARLWSDHGRTDEARALLSSVYRRFTEGFDTRDLRVAKALLEAMK